MTDDEILETLVSVVRTAIAQTGADAHDPHSITLQAENSRWMVARWAFVEARGVDDDLDRLADAGFLYDLGTQAGCVALRRGRLSPTTLAVRFL